MTTLGKGDLEGRQKASPVAGPQRVRDLPLLEGERIEKRFVPDAGLVSDTPKKGELLVLTNLRVMTFLQSDGHNDTFLAPLEELKGVSLKASTRGFKNLAQGIALIFAGVLAYVIIGYWREGISVAAPVGIALVMLGLMFTFRHFYWEEEGAISFRGVNWELDFPYKNKRASADMYGLVDRFFQLKLEPNSHLKDRATSPANGPEAGPTEGPPPTPPSSPTYHI